MHSGAVMVAGTASGVGKSTIAAALCRAFARRGVHVAPFKAQNMSNHAAVTEDGGEIGRAQAMQAMAARVNATVNMNPILIKPGPDMTSHVIVRGQEIAREHGFSPVRDNRREIVLDSYRSLARRHDLVVAEGAGGAAEINLLDRDLVNLPFAVAADMPAVLVVDIDRGGAFASAYGTIKILPDHLREQIKGILINSFRGDPAYLGDGLAQLEGLTGVPVLGVLPHLGPEPLLGVEDSLDLVGPSSTGSMSTRSTNLPTLRVAVVALPHLANPSDFDPLAMEPSVALSWARRPSDILAADLVIVPGTRATIVDLGWMESTGLADAVRSTKATVLGICGGYQMLGLSIDDEVESGEGRRDGLGLLKIETVFHTAKIVQRSAGSAAVGGQQASVTGYQIRYGRPLLQATTTPFLQLDGEAEGAVDPSGRISGTSLHGVFDDDAFRHTFLTVAAQRAGVSYAPLAEPFASILDRQHERLADWVEEHANVAMIGEIASHAAPPEQLLGWRI